MYNRYIPQSDGSYQRNQVSEPQKPTQSRKDPTPPMQPTSFDPDSKPSHKPESVGGFLRQLLPRQFDTADMIIVLLLLLLAGDSEEERTTALLTLALYVLM